MSAPGRGGPWRRLARALALLAALGLAGGGAWHAAALATAPDFAIWRQASEAEIRAALARIERREVTAERLEARLAALLAEDPRPWPVIDSVLEVGRAAGLAPPPALAARIEAARAEDSGLLARAGACARCVWDLGRCDAGALVICRLPVEISPAGDLAAIARQTGAWVQGAEVDRLDLALGLVGLAASGATLASGGGTLGAKAGLAFLRVAYRAGALAPG
ncbi:MAG: hypothetical protein D6832_00400, partial [Alphaproteobacteria bacterium]